MIEFVRAVIVCVILSASAMVVCSRQPMRSVMALFVCVIAIAMLWMTMAQEFLAYILLIMHAGALMTMFLFVTMTVSYVSDDRRHYAYVYTGIILLAALWVMLLGSVLPEVSETWLKGEHLNAILGQLWVSTYGGSLWLLGVMLTLSMMACVRLVQPEEHDVMRRQQQRDQVNTEYTKRLLWKESASQGASE